MSLYNSHPIAVSVGYQTISSWLLGYPDQACQYAQQTLPLVHSLKHSFSVAFLSFRLGLFYQFLQEAHETQTHAEDVITLAIQQGFVFYGALGAVLKGWALTKQGQEGGIGLIRQGLDVYQATGAALMRTWMLALLGEACGTMRQTEEGLKVLAEALNQVDQTGERFYEAEIYRLKGTLTLQKFQVSSSKFQVTNPQSLTPDPQAEAEVCFRKAIAVARRQRAKSWELRATVSLARLWQQQGKTAQARRMLAKIHDWFTEGFETVDLREAKALLVELER